MMRRGLSSWQTRHGVLPKAVQYGPNLLQEVDTQSVIAWRHGRLRVIPGNRRAASSTSLLKRTVHPAWWPRATVPQVGA